MTAIYVLFGFLYTSIGIFTLIFVGGTARLLRIFYLFGTIFMGILGFVGFAVFAAIYSGLARSLGGIEFDVTTSNQVIGP